ncbi:hypothetical protein MBLNU230_g2060t1 [Neophaeotheca triangularis]
MGLSDYLAQKYLSTDTKASKKRKRKDKAAEGLTLAEDDTQIQQTQADDDDDDDEAPTVVASGKLSAGLNKASKKAKWIKVGTSAPTNSDQAAADAILADAAAEQKQRAQDDEDAPAYVDDRGAEAEGPTMQNGAMAGLQSAEQVTAALKRKERAERKAMKEAGLDAGGKAQETIYRDASGRILNVEKMRAEMKDKADEEERKKAAEVEAAKGDVQRREKEERRQELLEAKVMPFARGKDDAKMNQKLKEVERWNDPMAKMLGTKSGKGKGKKGKASSGKTYQGPSEPNRYAIKPGWRWDGVDRGNGFERKWFAARANKSNREELEYMWQMDE